MRKAPNPRGRLCQRGRQDHIAVIEHRRHLPAKGMDLADGFKISGGVQSLGMGEGTATDAFNQIGRQRSSAQGLADTKGRPHRDDIGPRPHHPPDIGARQSGRHDMAQAFQQSRGIQHGAADLGVDGCAGKGGLDHHHPQAARWPADRIGMAALQGRGDIGRAQIRPGAGIEHDCGIAHAMGQEAIDRHPSPTLACIGAIWQARAGRLEAEEAAA